MAADATCLVGYDRPMQKQIPRHEIKHFVRHCLGCGCPDEVFDAIENGTGPLAGIPCQRIAVGGRLLVYRVLAEEIEGAGLSLVEAMLSEGRDERDRRGFNRFRLVLPRSWLDAEPNLTDLAASLPDADRLHLHFPDPEAMHGA